jgi:spore maturation protein A
MTAMRILWGAMVLLGVAGGVMDGSDQKLLDTTLAACGDAVTLSITLIGAYALWMGVMNIAKEAGLVAKLAKAMKPFTRRIFKGVPENAAAHEYIALNLSANMLGLGNAATPYGIRAMEELQKYNKSKRIATNAMCMLLIINASSVQLLPTTVMALRASAGSAEPAAIALPALIATTINTLFAILVAKAVERRS